MNMLAMFLLLGFANRDDHVSSISNFDLGN